MRVAQCSNVSKFRSLERFWSSRSLNFPKPFLILSVLIFCMNAGNILNLLFHVSLEDSSSLGFSMLLADMSNSDSHGKWLVQLLAAEEKSESWSELHKKRWSLVPLTAVVNQYFNPALIIETMRKNPKNIFYLLLEVSAAQPKARCPQNCKWNPHKVSFFYFFPLFCSNKTCPAKTL